jgi:hypothetical protein
LPAHSGDYGIWSGGAGVTDGARVFRRFYASGGGKATLAPSSACRRRRRRFGVESASKQKPSFAQTSIAQK